MLLLPGKALGNVENAVFKDSGHAKLPEIEDVFPLCISESGDELIAQSISFSSVRDVLAS